MKNSDYTNEEQLALLLEESTAVVVQTLAELLKDWADHDKVRLCGDTPFMAIPCVRSPGLFINLRFCAEVGFDTRLKACVEQLETAEELEAESVAQKVVAIMSAQEKMPAWAKELGNVAEA
jgi:hypothetical protein